MTVPDVELFAIVFETVRFQVAVCPWVKVPPGDLPIDRNGVGLIVIVSDENVPVVIPAPLNVNPLIVAVAGALLATFTGIVSRGYVEPAAIATILVHVNACPTAPQLQGEPLGSVPNDNPEGNVPVTIIACATVPSGSPVGPWPDASPLFRSENVTLPVPPWTI